MIHEFLPLAFAALVLLPVALVPVSRTADLLVTRAALSLFGGYVARRSPRRADQRRLLRAARVRQSHRLYAARTILIAGVIGVAGGVTGMYVGGVIMAVFRVNETAVQELVPPVLGDALVVPTFGVDEVFLLLLASSAVVGLGGAAVTYYARWEVLNQRAVARASAIEATLPRTVAFVYALSRSGTAFPKVLETLSTHRQAYGEAAEELSFVAREMDVFGTDSVTALGRMTDHTPSDSMDEFADNLASVLGSGRSLAPFLREQYDRYQDEARSQQEQHLDLLSTFAEVYVTLFVALPVFLVTILGIVGLVLDDTITLLRVLGYVALPSLTFAYVVYVDSVTETLPDRIARPDADATDLDRDPRRVARAGARTDGGVTAIDVANRHRLAVYDRIDGVRQRLRDPVDTLVERPARTLLLTLPIGAVWLAVRALPLVGASDTSLVAAVDGPVIEAALIVLGGFAAAHELRLRRTREIDRAVPDFLDRMASLDEAGLTVVGSLKRATQGDLGPLGDEVERAWRDVEWGADAGTALRRLDRRIGSLAVSQAVALVTNAMRASGDLAPVLRIAADETQQARRLRRERRREMFTYLLVIYVSALVFLGIVVGIIVAFFPAIASAAASAPTGAGNVGGPGAAITTGLSSVNLDAYRTVFFHLTAIQSVCSGLVAGQLGEGSVPDGVKHATILLAVTYAVFLFV